MSTTDEPQKVLETDARFPSGPWMGYFLQWQRQIRTELTLTFCNGIMTGAGGDFVGAFVVKGRYQTSDGKCWWTKQYLGLHQVAYSGWSEGQGIWGLWDIRGIGRGGFRIWPKGLEQDEELRLEEPIPEAELDFAEELFPLSIAGTRRLVLDVSL
jgi:hypothetical protein